VSESKPLTSPPAAGRLHLVAAVGSLDASGEAEPSAPQDDENDLVGRARPSALRLARAIARIWRVQEPSLLHDCEQAASLALIEARPGYDKTRGPFWVFAWKRVAGAVTRLLQRERGRGCTGFDDELDEAEDFHDTSDAFSADDNDDLATLKAWCRRLAFRRVLAAQRTALRAQPDNLALRAEVFRKLGVALGGLDDREARVIDLHYFQALVWKDVGEALNLSERQVKRIDQGIRERLDRDLRRAGVDEPPPSVDL